MKRLPGPLVAVPVIIILAVLITVAFDCVERLAEKDAQIQVLRTARPRIVTIQTPTDTGWKSLYEASQAELAACRKAHARHLAVDHGMPDCGSAFYTAGIERGRWAHVWCDEGPGGFLYFDGTRLGPARGSK